MGDLPDYDVSVDGSASGYVLNLNGPLPGMRALELKKTLTVPEGQTPEVALLKLLGDTRDEILAACDKKPDAQKEPCRNGAADAAVVAVAGEGGGIRLLHDLTLVVPLSVPPIGVEVAGAFTASFLTDPVYSLQPVPDSSPAKYKVFEDHAARDRARLGVAAMLHTYFPRFTPNWAATFGLGINNSSQVDYYFGITWRAYGQFFLTAGVDVGQQIRLPNGVAVDSTVTDANVLANPPRRTSGALFLAVSYAFLSPGRDTFARPFQTEPKTPPAPKQ
jgi:hypothetical protein